MGKKEGLCHLEHTTISKERRLERRILAGKLGSKKIASRGRKTLKPQNISGSILNRNG